MMSDLFTEYPTLVYSCYWVDIVLQYEYVLIARLRASKTSTICAKNCQFTASGFLHNADADLKTVQQHRCGRHAAI